MSILGDGNQKLAKAIFKGESQDSNKAMVDEIKKMLKQ